MNGPAAAPKPIPVMEVFAKELSGANQRVANIVGRLTELNAKIWGTTPVVADVGKEEHPGGLVSGLQADLNSLHVKLDSADALLESLERLI